MFSVENFYNIVYENLLKPLNIDQIFYKQFGSTDIQDLHLVGNKLTNWDGTSKVVISYDQEPIYNTAVSSIWDSCNFPNPNHHFNNWKTTIEGSYHYDMKYFSPNFLVFANSEHSQEKNNFLKTLDNCYDWYYFYHGFAALDWFGNIPYRQPITQYSRVFISFNNLYTENRSYRLSLIAGIMERGLLDRGWISMSQEDIVEKIKGEIFSNTSRLSVAEKKSIYKNLLPDPPRLIIDTENHHGALSANDDLTTMSQGLWHLVTETIYYDDKLHLTEKIFKPMVARRPFILVGATGNLAYLRSYGFQTFDRWIDESYDLESDPERRMQMILNQVEYLCTLSAEQLDNMYQEMQEVLQHNFNWMYSGFRKQITNELVDNFRRCLIQHNAGRDAGSMNYIDHSHLDWTDIKQRLSH